MSQHGGARGTQTLDFFHAMEALYQLSYSPTILLVYQRSGEIQKKKTPLMAFSYSCYAPTQGRWFCFCLLMLNALGTPMRTSLAFIMRHSAAICNLC